MNIELKPCPFCGGEANFTTTRTRVDSHDEIEFVFYIECSECYTHLPQYYAISCRLDSKGNLVTTRDVREKAIEEWNTRTGEE